MSEKMLLQPEDYEFKIEKEKGQEILDNKNKVCYLHKKKPAV